MADAPMSVEPIEPAGAPQPGVLLSFPSAGQMAFKFTGSSSPESTKTESITISLDRKVAFEMCLKGIALLYSEHSNVSSKSVHVGDAESSTTEDQSSKRKRGPSIVSLPDQPDAVGRSDVRGEDMQ